MERTWFHFQFQCPSGRSRHSLVGLSWFKEPSRVSPLGDNGSGLLQLG